MPQTFPDILQRIYIEHMLDSEDIVFKLHKVYGIHAILDMDHFYTAKERQLNFS